LVVLIVNITDAPGANPVQVDVYNKTLDPGAQVRIPADLVDSKLRALEKSGLIAIGSLPPWYEAAKKRKGRALSAEEMANRIVSPKANVVPIKAGNKENKKDSVDTEETPTRKQKV
jgi:hypothetical protein